MGSNCPWHLNPHIGSAPSVPRVDVRLQILHYWSEYMEEVIPISPESFIVISSPAKTDCCSEADAKLP
jgi:hypothetical protein